MPSIVCFKTPTSFDLRSLTVFGLSSKPNSSQPIGKFGTGLKYAIAGILRAGFDVEITEVGEFSTKSYSIRTAQTSFRGKDCSQIELVSVRNHRRPMTMLSQTLPFTTELGPHWETWMLVRELVCNTKDEGGEILFFDSKQDFKQHVEELEEVSTHTLITVSWPEFIEIASNPELLWLDATKHELLWENANIQIFDGPLDLVFNQNVRVWQLHPHSELLPFGINFKAAAQLPLTEDRTASLSEIWHKIWYEISSQCTDPTVLDRFISQLSRFEPGYWINDLSPEFAALVVKQPKLSPLMVRVLLMLLPETFGQLETTPTCWRWRKFQDFLNSGDNSSDKLELKLQALSVPIPDRVQISQKDNQFLLVGSNALDSSENWPEVFSSFFSAVQTAYRNAGALVAYRSAASILAEFISDSGAKFNFRTNKIRC